MGLSKEILSMRVELVSVIQVGCSIEGVKCAEKIKLINSFLRVWSL